MEVERTATEGKTHSQSSTTASKLLLVVLVGLNFDCGCFASNWVRRQCISITVIV